MLDGRQIVCVKIGGKPEFKPIKELAVRGENSIWEVFGFGRFSQAKLKIMAKHKILKFTLKDDNVFYVTSGQIISTGDRVTLKSDQKTAKEFSVGEDVRLWIDRDEGDELNLIQIKNIEEIECETNNTYAFDTKKSTYVLPLLSVLKTTDAMYMREKMEIRDKDKVNDDRCIKGVIIYG